MKPSAILLLVLSFVFLTAANAQQLRFPRESQAASVTQRIGLTDITISYSRPAVKGREIWGKLVPYNQVWRAGANENTTIKFTDDVTINGNKLAAGTYGIHTIPSEQEWTLIFSKQFTAWGSFFYDEKEDVLRMKVTPVKASHTEHLEYSFTDVTPNSAMVNLNWEQLSIPFNIEVDVHSVVVNNFKKELIGAPGFQWLPYNQAANYCVINKTHLDEAKAWVDKSIGINKNYTNLTTKARLLELAGNNSEADELKTAAFKIATEAEINTYGYQLLAEKKIDEAIEIFKKNVKDYPGSWNTYDSLGEAYMIKGDKKLAHKYYSTALEMVTDEQTRTRIRNTLKQLQ